MAFTPFCNRSPAPTSPLTIRIYSIRTGQNRSWASESRVGSLLGLDLTGVNLSWQGNDRDLGFTWISTRAHRPYFAVLDTEASGTRLPGGLLLPAKSLQATLTPDGQLEVITPGGRLVQYSRNVLSESTLPAPSHQAARAAAGPASRLFMVLWASSSGRVLIVLPARLFKGELVMSTQVGVLTGGHYQRLPAPFQVPVW